MDKLEVEHILISLKSGTEEALSIKIYKNGILARRGCGGVPAVAISGMSFTGDSSYFDKLMQHVPQHILDEHVNHEEKILTKSLEYIVAFYGVSKNGDQGERAEWTKSTGIRFFMDEGTSFRHNILGFADGLAVEAMKLTDSWYFDIVMLALDKMKSNALPAQSLVSASTNEEELDKDFNHYFQQVDKKALTSFASDKVYTDGADVAHTLNFTSDDNSITYKFEPLTADAN